MSIDVTLEFYWWVLQLRWPLCFVPAHCIKAKSLSVLVGSRRGTQNCGGFLPMVHLIQYVLSFEPIFDFCAASKCLLSTHHTPEIVLYVSQFRWP